MIETHSSAPQARLLHLDCRAGLAGDMLFAALADFAAPWVDLQPLHDMLQPLAQVLPVREVRRGVAGTRLEIRPAAAAADQPLRHLPELLAIVEGLPVSEAVRARASRAFARLAEAEAAVHGVAVEAIHFHEVGAVDTIVDVVAACWIVEALGVGRITASPVPWFTGMVRCAHGDMPLPAPATVRLLQGKPVFPTDTTWELVTPTGALLLDTLVDAYTAGPAGVLLDQGTGYGANPAGDGLRVFLCEAEPTPPELQRVWVLECTLDHLTGEELGAALQAIMDAEALDVIFLPGMMKKNRPGGLLQVLCDETALQRVEAAVFRHTCTLGLRRTLAQRRVLPRQAATLGTPFGELVAKEAQGLGEGAPLLRPEHEAMQTLAATLGMSVVELRLRLQQGAGK
ncbi:MAG: LarC family nickel insertion protein [Desulfovibrio sp.]|nr:LarC family nickel insertion protein [Desulfovibrio sp.]MCA1985523.1 LarC family nickel insertion protein [Desulfovibrio sp.]